MSGLFTHKALTFGASVCSKHQRHDSQFVENVRNKLDRLSSRHTCDHTFTSTGSLQEGAECLSFVQLFNPNPLL